MTFKTYGLVQPEIDLQVFVNLLLDMTDNPDQEPPEPGHVEDHLAS